MLPPKPLLSHQATLLPLLPTLASLYLVKPYNGEILVKSFNAQLRGYFRMKPPGQDWSPSPKHPLSALFSVPSCLQPGAPKGQK